MTRGESQAKENCLMHVCRHATRGPARLTDRHQHLSGTAVVAATRLYRGPALLGHLTSRAPGGIRGPTDSGFSWPLLNHVFHVKPPRCVTLNRCTDPHSCLECCSGSTVPRVHGFTSRHIVHRGTSAQSQRCSSLLTSTSTSTSTPGSFQNVGLPHHNWVGVYERSTTCVLRMTHDEPVVHPCGPRPR